MSLYRIWSYPPDHADTYVPGFLPGRYLTYREAEDERDRLVRECAGRRDHLVISETCHEHTSQRRYMCTACGQ